MFDTATKSALAEEPIVSSPSPGSAAPVKHNPIQKVQKRKVSKMSEEE